MTNPAAPEDFQALSATQRRNVALVEYQCGAKDHCRLMTIWQGRGTRFWYTPPYTLSETTAHRETVESARLKRTTDGLRQWTARAGSLDDLLDFADGLPDDYVGLGVNCRHLRNRVIPWRQLQADAEQTRPGKPTWITVRRDD